MLVETENASLQVPVETTHWKDVTAIVEKLATRGSCISIQMDARGWTHVDAFVVHMNMTAVNQTVPSKEDK